jgi:hypothetical protein
MASSETGPSQESSVLELLALLVSRRTAPGQGHVFLSAVELDGRLRQEVTHLYSERLSEPAFKALRNEFAHVVITTNYDKLIEGAIRARRWDLNAADTEFRSDELLSALTRAKKQSVSDEWLDTAAMIADNFIRSLVAGSDILGKLTPDEAARLARSAAEGVLASARWSQVVGDRLDTTAVTQLLGITRQALAKRQAAGSVIGLPGQSTTWYPTWQFDQNLAEIRPEVRHVVGAFRDRLDDVDPFLIAAWATTPQDEDLEGLTPETWIRLGRDPQQLRIAAERAAAHMAR